MTKKGRRIRRKYGWKHCVGDVCRFREKKGKLTRQNIPSSFDLFLVVFTNDALGYALETPFLRLNKYLCRIMKIKNNLELNFVTKHQNWGGKL